MKTKFIIGICLLVLLFFAISTLKAQDIQYSAQANISNQISKNVSPGYTYKLFQAPNKMYGYDIFLSKKIIFHQGASPAQSNEFTAAISTKAKADKAALLSIEKIKKHETAALTQQELRKIITK